MIDEPRYSTAEVCTLAGLTYRQADYLAPWVGLGREGSGARRRWSRRQAVQAFVVTTLMRAGLRGIEASSVAQLVAPGTEFLVVPPDVGEAYAAHDLLDVLDGIESPATTVVRLPARLVGLISAHPVLAHRH